MSNLSKLTIEQLREKVDLFSVDAFNEVVRRLTIAPPESPAADRVRALVEAGDELETKMYYQEPYGWVIPMGERNVIENFRRALAAAGKKERA